LAEPADGCRDPALEAEPACTEGPLCSRAERVRLACDLRDALKARYVFFNRKAKLLAVPGRAAFDASHHLDECVAAERGIEREDDPLRFVDRLRRCIAAFEDGHLFLAMPHPLPAVSLGVRLRRTEDGRVYVAYRDPGLARWLEESSSGGPSLKVGEEVVAVDGQPVAEAMSKLADLIPASSAAARTERAVDALTRRDFAYPERKEAILTVSVDGQLRAVPLPWFVAPGASAQPLAASYLRRTQLQSSDRIEWRPDPRGAWFRDGGVSEGLLRGDPVVAPEDAARLETYRGEGGQLAVRVGVASGDGPPLCYAQLLSFHTETLTDSGGRSHPFVDVLRDFLRGCEERRLDLLLDLRQNEGGYLSHSSALAAMLTPGKTITPGGALLLRATAQNERVYRERSPMLGASGAQPPGGVPSEPEQILMAIRDARRAKDEFTPAFLEPALSDDDDGGFTGHVVVLTSPGCMSACDRLAALLRRGQRALLVGGPTEGAGASQQESKDQSARWSDRGGFVGVSIPNAAMGVQTSASTRATKATAEQFFEQLAFENRPVEPDRRYATALSDLLFHNRGWREAARAALESVEASTASPAPSSVPQAR